MEDREFEELKFKFERYKHLDDERIGGYTVFDKQCFTFNVGLLTLIFFAIYQSLEYSIPKYWYIFSLLPIFLCGASCVLLMNTYSITHRIIDIQQELVFDFNEEQSKICDILKDKNVRNTKWAFRFLIFGFIITVLTIFFAIFKVDFKKEKEVYKVEIINNSMALSPNITSFDQRQHNENIKATPSNSLDHRPNQAMQQNVTPKPQKPQPESTTKQPSNTQ